MTSLITKLGYYGKLPSNGDFIRAGDYANIVKALDRWLALTMELLAHDARWKLYYDKLSPIDFVFLSPRSRKLVACHLVASQDSAQRRFPFVSLGGLNIDEPSRFAPLAPLALARLWARQAELVCRARTDKAGMALLNEMAHVEFKWGEDSTRYQEIFTDFLDSISIARLEALLATQMKHIDVRKIFLALAVLFAPVSKTRMPKVDKSLVFPLPEDELQRSHVAALWIHVLMPFVRHLDSEWAVLITQRDGCVEMVIGLSGASPHLLHAMIDPELEATHRIRMDACDWVDACLGKDPELARFASLVEREDSSLKAACALLREKFSRS